MFVCTSHGTVTHGNVNAIYTVYLPFKSVTIVNTQTCHNEHRNEETLSLDTQFRELLSDSYRYLFTLARICPPALGDEDNRYISVPVQRGTT